MTIHRSLIAIIFLIAATLACSLQNQDDVTSEPIDETPIGEDINAQLPIDCPDPIEYVEEPSPTEFDVVTITPSTPAIGCVYMEPNTTVTISLPDAPEGFPFIEFWYIPTDGGTRGDVIGTDNDSSDGASISFTVYPDMYGYIYVQGARTVEVSGTGFSNEPLMITTRQQ